MTPPRFCETIAHARSITAAYQRATSRRRFRDKIFFELIDRRPHSLFLAALAAMGHSPMCLAIPAQISELLDDRNELAMVDIMGVRRRINIDLLADDPPKLGDWVLIHVGFAMSKIGAEQAEEQLRLLAMLGEATAAEEEVAGYEFADDGIKQSDVSDPAAHMDDSIAEKNVSQTNVAATAGLSTRIEPPLPTT